MNPGREIVDGGICDALTAGAQSPRGIRGTDGERLGIPWRGYVEGDENLDFAETLIPSGGFIVRYL